MTRLPLSLVTGAVAVAVAVASTAAAAPMLRLSSPAFGQNGRIPALYTCKGQNKSPALRWTAPPARTRSFAIELIDHDAPVPGGFVHWLGWNLTARARGNPVGRPFPLEGANGTGQPGYVGPCPPSGVHHYPFVLYALDTSLTLPAGSDVNAFRRALRGHVLARARLVGLFGS